MSFSTHENIITSNNEPIEINHKNQKSAKKIITYYDNLKPINKSTLNILRKVENKNNLENKNLQTQEYGSENTGDEHLNRKSQFDLFRNNVGYSNNNTNNSNYSKCKNNKNSIKKKYSNDNSIIKTLSSIKSNYSNNINNNDRNSLKNRGSKFSIFEARKISHKKKSRHSPNDEKRSILVNK